ncbi:hypothetical protein [Paratractidigestivibacter sp.]|uniref:hypothetical protein n=1 Tax=Paratractidigestivibacter sp. TaxID=2847316 RepID=UPI004024FABA
MHSLHFFACADVSNTGRASHTMHSPSVPVEKRPYRCRACLTALGVTLSSAAISAAVRSGCACIRLIISSVHRT